MLRCADIFERHEKRNRAAKTAWILLNFQSYVKYHIKVSWLDDRVPVNAGW